MLTIILRQTWFRLYMSISHKPSHGQTHTHTHIFKSTHALMSSPVIVTEVSIRQTSPRPLRVVGSALIICYTTLILIQHSSSVQTAANSIWQLRHEIYLDLRVFYAEISDVSMLHKCNVIFKNHLRKYVTK